MPIKNLNSFFNLWFVWGLLATLTLALPLLNAWLGFPGQALYEELYSAVGGIVPYSDAAGYLQGGHRLIDLGYLDSWNMRRPLNALFLAFRLKIANGNFWYVMLFQLSFIIFALTLYLGTLRKDLGSLATIISLAFFFFFAQFYNHTTLSEPLGLTLGLLSFVLLWNGWNLKTRLTFNAGMAALAMALCVRAGPNFMVLSLLLLVYLHPFTQSRSLDLLWSGLSFAIPFIFITKLSTFYGDPSSSGEAFSNFSTVVYGLVNGGKGWLYASQDPHASALIAGKSESELSRILYQESWRIFKDNPLNLLRGLSLNLWNFFYYFIRSFSFGSGIVRLVTTILLVMFGFFIGFRISAKRHFLNREFLFLTITFLGIAVSSTVIFRDGGFRTFAVAIPFMGALFALAFASPPYMIERKTFESICSACFVGFILIASALAPYIPSKMNVPYPAPLAPIKIPGQDVVVTYNVNKQPHLIIDSASGLHFRTISPTQIEDVWDIYQDSPFGMELKRLTNKYKNNNLVLLFVYDYISHSNKWILSEKHILDLNSEWLTINCDLIEKDFKLIYKANSFIGIPNK